MIISIKEARKLLSSTAKDMSDEEVERLISDLHFLAKHALEMYKMQLSAKNKPDSRDDKGYNSITNMV